MTSKLTKEEVKALPELIVYSKRVAEELMREGFVLKRVEPNKKSPKFLIFIFDKTEGLESAFVRLTHK